MKGVSIAHPTRFGRVSFDTSTKTSALTGVLAVLLIGACGKPPVKAPSLTLTAFTLTTSESQLAVSADGRVKVDGNAFGTVSPDGRFVDADGALLATYEAGILRDHEDAILGELDNRGTVTQTGQAILSFASDGAVTGDAIADYEQAIRFRGPADARPLAALVLFGLADSVAFLKAASRALGGHIETEARRFCDALAAGDAAGLHAQMISHASLAAVTSRAPTRDDYNAEVTEWVDARVREIKGSTTPVACARADIVARETLGPSDRLLRSIDITSSRPVLLVDGTERPAPFPIHFIRIDGVWKASIEK